MGTLTAKCAQCWEPVDNCLCHSHFTLAPPPMLSRQLLTVTFPVSRDVRLGLARHLGRSGETATVAELEETVRAVVADVFEQLSATPYPEKKTFSIKRRR